MNKKSKINQKILLKIVRNWKINKKPEYRGFKCGICSKDIRKAWHYWLLKYGYKTPVHLCNDCKRKFKSSENSEIYKIFTCDNCGKNIFKAYHCWNEKSGILSESHFCKKCEEKFSVNNTIKGLIYDLDGTIISTIKLHEAGWLYTGKKFNIPISKQMLLNQRGISNEAAAEMMLPDEKKHLMEKFIAAKAKYVIENIKLVTLQPNVLKVIEKLSKNDFKLWICTSARKKFVKRILNRFPRLKRIFGKNVVWREMYKKEKPSSEALNIVTKKMKLKKSQVYYIGDAFSDYKTAINNKIGFVYFCPNLNQRDLRIPQSIPTITSHEKIFNLFMIKY